MLTSAAVSLLPLWELCMNIIIVGLVHNIPPRTAPSGAKEPRLTAERVCVGSGSSSSSSKLSVEFCTVLASNAPRRTGLQCHRREGGEEHSGLASPLPHTFT